MDVIERDVVRAVVLDRAGRVLLLQTRDPKNAYADVWWELPGGGIDPGETVVEAVIRELAEETGLVATPAQVGPATWRRRASYFWNGERRLSNEVVVPIRLAVDAPDIDGTDRTEAEHLAYLGHRWWPQPELTGAAGQRFYPGRLPGLLTEFLSGSEIDEPVEIWN